MKTKKNSKSLESKYAKLRHAHLLLMQERDALKEFKYVDQVALRNALDHLAKKHFIGGYTNRFIDELMKTYYIIPKAKTPQP